MNNILLYIAFCLIVFVAFFHSYAGQKRLIGPLLAHSNDILDNPTWRAIIYFGWHSTTALMLVIGFYIFLVAGELTAGSYLFLGLIGLTYIGLGLANGIIAKFKHPGWIMLSSIGIITISSLYI